MNLADWFTDPWYLLLVLAVPPIVAGWLYQSRNALRHSAARYILGPQSLRARTARWGGAVLRALALLLLVLAVAGIRWRSEERTRIETEGIAVVMVVDISGSMGQDDFKWNDKSTRRIDAVKRAFHLFVVGKLPPGVEDLPGAPKFKGRPSDLIGLITFATRPEKMCPPTLSHSALLQVLKTSEPIQIPTDSETNLSDALALAIQRLDHAGPNRKKVVILLTDGEHNVNPIGGRVKPKGDSPGDAKDKAVETPAGWKPRQVGQLAMSLEIPIYTIDAGADPDLTSTLTEDDRKKLIETRQDATKTLNELATMTRGQTFQAHDMSSLLKACQAIDQLEPDIIKSSQYRLYDPLYKWFGLASFVVLLLILLLDLTFWRRVP